MMRVSYPDVEGAGTAVAVPAPDIIAVTVIE